MEPNGLMEISREAIYVLIKMAAPILLIALSVGLIISLLQALTQIQENTLSFVPKILAVFLALLFFTPNMISTLQIFSEHLSQAIIEID